MNPEHGRHERNRYVIFILALSYSAFALGLIIENFVVGWEPWALPFLVISMLFAWWVHLKQPFTESGRIYALATIYYGATFYQGVHESSLFDTALIICFVFFLFSLADDFHVFDVGLLVYFGSISYQIAVHYGLAAFSDPLTFAKLLLHVLIVVVSARFARSMISGRQRTSEMQGRAFEQLTELHKRTEDFMANISHELRTPINAVTGLSALLLDKDSGAGEEVLSICQAGNRLSEQVSDILDYTEIDTGRLILSTDTYGTYSVINDVVSRFRMKNPDFPTDLVIDVDATVPAKLRGDSRRIKKILWHLLDNANKFTRAGGIYLRITSDKRSYGINLCVEVSDTGVGIEPEEVRKIARGFYQADSGRTRSAGGMGLGLAIVYGFVHAMGGFVSLTSNPGQGTTVRLSIPQEVADPSPCMSVADPEKLSIACYLRSEKFDVPLVRDYYEAMITHLVHGLHVPIRRAGSLEDLKQIAEQMAPTHFFTAKEEYEEDPAFFLRLAKSAEVIIVADQNFKLDEESRITILRKPFYGFPIAAILNTLNVGGEIDPLKNNYRVSFPGLKVLVVDDEEMNLVVANGIFTGYGMQVQTALSGKASTVLYDKEDFDLVFMDHMMPEMDGIEAMKLLRKTAQSKNRDTRFVALTANAVSGAREMFLSEGFDGFLPKPLDTAEMERLLARILPAGKVLMEKIEMVDETDQILKAQSGEALGIERCLGDKAFYNRLRRIFIEEMPHNMRVFKSAYATGTMEPYFIRLRALRNGAQILGERALSRQARRLERAIEDNDSKRIQKEHMELVTVYTACIQKLERRAQEEGDEV
ncbi:MAG: response regulator [Lachnospiraceae bacterium]|nr:response regulator [Lachnospiraceae bacterium]